MLRWTLTTGAVLSCAFLALRADDDFWAFQPVRDPSLPAVNNAAWCQSPIDQFILARLEKEGMTSSPTVSKRGWLRRVTFDVTGLPPTREAIESFLEDQSTDAYSKVVDRLLASPSYGEQLRKQCE